MSKELFDAISMRCSKLTTQAYSTSFSWGIRCLKKEFRAPIYSIYGFVRFADEIVDAFHDYDKVKLFSHFKEETYRAIEDKISLNPILNSFQQTVHRYRIEKELYDHFLSSMEMDLTCTFYDRPGIDKYILGSAEGVGLMCLRVFCEGDERLYRELSQAARKLGSGFQKINFLRDLKYDFHEMGRSYFPEIDLTRFDEGGKHKIEEEIKKDLEEAYKGIKKLPKSARWGVYVAYLYYRALLGKIENTPHELMLKNRVRIDNGRKLTILAYSYFKYQFNLI